jgi:hypothetical protein
MIEPIFPRERLVSDTNVSLTKALFLEYNFNSKIDPVYTLKEYDHRGCLSMYKIYIECGSEYEAAIKLLGSWSHWNKLLKAQWFFKHVEKWREERILKEAAVGRATLMEKAKEGSVSAAKELLSFEKMKDKVSLPEKKKEALKKQKMEEADKKVVSMLERVGYVN